MSSLPSGTSGSLNLGESVVLSPDALRALRTRAQGLAVRHPREALIDAVRAVCGVQAQLSPATMLALRARVSDLRSSDVADAIAQSRNLVRTWAMRGTLHLLAAEDIRWLVVLLGPIFAAKDSRRRLQLGIDDALSAAGLREIRAILRDSAPLTRHEIRDRLAERGVAIQREGQALIHLISQAAFEGMLCLGPDRADGKSTYALLDQWIDRGLAMPRREALSQLARRYLAGYGPADLKDFAVWSGLALTDAKQGWTALHESNRLVETRVEDRPLWSLAPLSAPMTDARRMSPARPIVRLLPAFDTYVLGYANRDDLVRPEHRTEVYHGGQTAPVILVDGLVAGTWRYDRESKRLKVTIRAFDAFTADVQRLIAEEADDIGRFWRTPISLVTDTHA
jgi:hypothetical protein